MAKLGETRMARDRVSGLVIRVAREYGVALVVQTQDQLLNVLAGVVLSC